MTLSSMFLVFALLYSGIKCTCRHSYMTFCDDLNDLSNYNVENWTDLVVGKETTDSAKLRSIDFLSLGIPLRTYEKLTTLIVVRQINEIKPNTFRLYPRKKLEVLKLYGNEIKRIRFTTFDSCILRKLSLANNSIEYFHKGAFYNCRIQTIDLSDNKIEMVEKGIFNEEFLYNDTKEIILKNNRLETIHTASFPSSLEILNLDHNNLEFIVFSTFENLINLQELTLSYNKLKTFTGLKDLKKIRVIDVSHNKISTLSPSYFNDLSTLEVLDLSHNRIFDPSIFCKFSLVERYPPLQISLAFNRFTHLIIDGSNFRQHVVFLYGNPWNCKCWALLEKFMVDNKVIRNRCDLEFFGNGQVPYCMDLPFDDCANATKTSLISDIDFQQFSEIVKKSYNHVTCNLSPKRL